MSNVIGLRGEEIQQPGEVNPDVVELAQRLLDMAASGEIGTLVAVWVHADETVGARQMGTSSYRLVGMLTKTVHDICEAMG